MVACFCKTHLICKITFIHHSFSKTPQSKAIFLSMQELANGNH